MTKFIFVTGGVISGLGKGVISASIGAVLQMFQEKNLTVKKLDPYLNIDPGTMNPTEHGEVFVTKDGTETDLDLGYYERFLGIETSELNSTSSGKLFQQILQKERKGEYLGKTVQMIPHFTEMIKDFICDNPNNYDYIICEIGGCVGDIEAMAFYEAIRQLRNDIGNENILFVHLTYIVYYSITDEMKTKPTQNNIRELQQVGITPDILICRTEHPISHKIKEKLSLHTNLPILNIIEVVNFSSIYEVPLSLIREQIDVIISKKFKIQSKIHSDKWKGLNHKLLSLKKSISIGLVGKYTELNDSYKSLLEAISHAGLYHNYKINIEWINAREEINLDSKLNGVIIPGGFGTTGIENMIDIIETFRNENIPVLGICLGMQLLVIEFFRNVLKIKEATSSEFESEGENIITKIDNSFKNKDYGGTMRLGSFNIRLKEGSKVNDIYQKNIIQERHRHRYHIDSQYSNELEENGCSISGLSEEKQFIEIVEIRNHPWYIGCQYHPEYQSTPFHPHPLFISFIQHSIKIK